MPFPAHSRLSIAFALITCGLLAIPAAPYAADFYWDADAATDGNQNGSGIWAGQPGSLLWTPAASVNGSSNQAWVNALDSIAHLGADDGYTNAGTGGTLTLGENITLNQLRIGAQAGAYTLTAAAAEKLIFDGASPVLHQGSAATLTVQAGLQLASGLVKTGTGRVVLSAPAGSSSGSGVFAIQDGTVQLAAANTLPTGMSMVLGSQTTAGSLEVDQDQTLARLSFESRSGAVTNSVTIAEGATLTVNGNMVTGILDGTSDNTTTLATVQGGGSLVVNGDFVVSSGAKFDGFSGTDNSTLDLSGLASFTATVNRFDVGRARNEAGNYQGTGKPQATLYLAESNQITATTLVVGARAATGSASNFMYLGQENVLNIGNMVLANGRFNGTLAFAAGLENPTLILRGETGGESRVNRILLGDSRNVGQVGASGGSSQPHGIMDLTGGTVDLMIDTLSIGIGGTNSGSNSPNFGRGTGTFTFDGENSRVDVNILNVGFSPDVSNSNPTQTSPYLSAVGNFNMNGGLLTVNERFIIAFSDDGATGREQMTQGTFTMTAGELVVGSAGSPVNIVLGDHARTGAGMSTAELNLNGGSASINGSIIRGAGPTEGTVNINGTALNLNGGSIGTAALPVVLNLQSGGLANVAEINGGGAVDKTGTGTLTLTGTNSFTGALSVAGGRLVVTSQSALQSASSVTVGSAGTFDFLPGDGSSYTFAAISGTALNLQSGATLGMELGSSTGALILNPGATVNPATGAQVNLNLHLLPGQSAPASSVLISAPGGGLLANGAGYSLGAVYNATHFTLSISASDTQITAEATGVEGLPAAYWKGGFAADNDAWAASNGSTQSNWVTENGTATGLVPGAGTAVFFTAPGATLPASTELGADMDIGSLTVNTSSALTLNSPEHRLSIHDNAAITVNAGAGAVTLNTLLDLLGDNPEISVGNTGGLMLNGEISGSGGLTKTGAGTLTLGATVNLYSGRTSILGGTLAIGSEYALGGVQENAVADYLLLNGGTLRALESFAIADPKRGITLASGGGVFEVDAGKTLAIFSPLTGNGFLAKTGDGRLELNTASSHAGATAIMGGTLALAGGDNRLPATTALQFIERRDTPYGASTLDLGGNSQSLASLQFISDAPHPDTNPSTLSNQVVFTHGSLVLNNTSNDTSFGTASQFQALELDMAGLDSFTYNGTGRLFRIGLTGGGHRATATTPAATVTLSRGTNTLTASTLTMGDNAGSSGGGLSSLYLGQTNMLNFNTISLANTRSSALLTFAGELLDPTVRIRGSNGSSAVQSWSMGNLDNYTNNSWSSIADFSAGSLDALVQVLTVGEVRNRFGTLDATFVMGAGTLEAEEIKLGLARGTNTGTPGTRMVNSEFVLDGPGTVTVTSLQIAENSSNVSTGNATANGTLTVNGGTFSVGSSGVMMGAATHAGFSSNAWLHVEGGIFSTNGDIAESPDSAGSVTSSITLNGGTMNLNGNDIGTAARPIDTLTFQKGALQNVGEINGGGAFVKSGGSGDILRLGGTHTFTGSTTVSGGSLLVNGTHTGGASYSVQSGATLGGSGTVTLAAGENITIGAGGTLAVGDAGTLSGQTLTLSTSALGTVVFTDGTSTLTLSIWSDNGTDHTADAAAADRLAVSGDIQLNGARLQIQDPNALAATFTFEDTWQLFDWSGITGSGFGEGSNVFTIDPQADLPSLAPGYSWDLSNLYTTGVIAVIPEPGRAAFLVLAALLALGRRRRQV